MCTHMANLAEMILASPKMTLRLKELAMDMRDAVERYRS